MQLAVDIGNTRVKTGLFDGEELMRSSVSIHEPEQVIKDLLANESRITALIISSVKQEPDASAIGFTESIKYINFNSQTPLPFNVSYQTPETLGLDRLALAGGALVTFPGKNCLVVDCGTCMTMELITAEREYLGGVISPGIQMRLDAMHRGTARLPLVKHNQKSTPLIGKSTEESLRSGAVNGMLNEINGAISRFEKQFEGLKVILTGGDLELFENELKSGIFADPNLVLRGLNKILLHNFEKL